MNLDMRTSDWLEMQQFPPAVTMCDQTPVKGVYDTITDALHALWRLCSVITHKQTTASGLLLYH